MDTNESTNEAVVTAVVNAVTLSVSAEYVSEGEAREEGRRLIAELGEQGYKIVPTPVTQRHVSFYTSADAPGPDATWSVYREEYPTPDSDEPIDGTQVKVLTCVDEQGADLAAAYLYQTEVRR